MPHLEDKGQDFGKRFLQVVTGKDVVIVRKDNVVPLLCRCDGEGIILCEDNGGFVSFGEDNIYPVLEGGGI